MKLPFAKLNPMRTAGLAGLAAALLAACGGGDPVEKFEPGRIVVFGDEASVIDDSGTPNQGLKYTVNGIGRNTDGTLNGTRDCTRNPIWAQVLANDYGFQFSQCLSAGATPRAFTRATVNGTAATVSAAVTAEIAGAGLSSGDLVAIMVGTHDVLAAAALPTPADARAAAIAAGTAVGAEVVRITERGAKVLVSTIPDVGGTPQGLVSAQSALLSDLTTAFNDALRIKLQEVRGGGHSAGLVLGNEVVLVMRRSPSAYGIVNTTDAACVNALPDCDETDPQLVLAARTTHAADWLWADPLNFGSNAHTRLGQATVFRARNNPF